MKILCCSSVAVTSPAAAAGLWNVPSSFAIVSDFDLAYCISCPFVSLKSQQQTSLGTTNQLVTEELKPLQRAHSLCSCLRIAEYNVRLPSHLHRLHGDDIEDGSIGGEEGVER